MSLNLAAHSIAFPIPQNSSREYVRIRCRKRKGHASIALVQQQPPPVLVCTPWPWPTCTVGLLLTVAVPMRSLICRAMVKKACSTFEAFLAEVSRKGMPRLSANSWQNVRFGSNEGNRADGTHFRNRVLDHLLVLHVALVAHQELVDTLSGIPINFLQPLLHVVERIHIRHIVDNADSMSAPVVRGRDCSEAFLASRIPLHWSVYTYYAFRKKKEKKSKRTICNFTVLPSSSMVRIFWSHDVSGGRQPSHRFGNLQSPHRWWRCSFLCRCHRQSAAASRTSQRRSLR